MLLQMEYFAMPVCRQMCLLVNLLKKWMMPLKLPLMKQLLLEPLMEVCWLELWGWSVSVVLRVWEQLALACRLQISPFVRPF
jgi:hypothetical protein